MELSLKEVWEFIFKLRAIWIFGAIALMLGVVIPGDFKFLFDNAPLYLRKMGALLLSIGLGLHLISILMSKLNNQTSNRKIIFIIIISAFLSICIWGSIGYFEATFIAPNITSTVDATTIALVNIATAYANLHATETAISPPTPNATVSAAFELLTLQAIQHLDATSTQVARNIEISITQTSSIQCPDPYSFNGDNNDWPWQRCIRYFDVGDIPMVLVPRSDIWKNQPFWIDQFEITRRQYLECSESVGARIAKCIGIPTEFNLDDTLDTPIRHLQWTDAYTYCYEWRGGNLPTLEQWDYVMHGPDRWKYPWGNLFVSKNVVNSGRRPLPANLDRGDRSWVGAYDMAGNVREFLAKGNIDELRIRGGAYSYRESSILNLTNEPVEIDLGTTWEDTGIRCVRNFSSNDLAQ